MRFKLFHAVVLALALGLGPALDCYTKYYFSLGCAIQAVDAGAFRAPCPGCEYHNNSGISLDAPRLRGELLLPPLLNCIAQLCMCCVFCWASLLMRQ